jgi:hypothetical protein
MRKALGREPTPVMGLEMLPLVAVKQGVRVRIWVGSRHHVGLEMLPPGCCLNRGCMGKALGRGPTHCGFGDVTPWLLLE